MTNSFESLYGKQGIDTPYEREQFTYRPDLSYTKEYIRQILPQEIQQQIERSRTFKLSQVLMDYDELIKDIEQMLSDIEERNNPDKMRELKSLLKNKDYKELSTFEKENSNYNQTGDFEMYSMLFQLRETLVLRREFLDNRFRTQITNQTEIEDIQQAEDHLIDEWEQIEAKTLEGYQKLMEHEDEGDAIDDESGSTQIPFLNYEDLEVLERQKRKKELFHISLADISYVHRNRCLMLINLVENAKILVYRSNDLIKDQLKEFILSFNDLHDIQAVKIHLILAFRDIRKKHQGLKGQMMMIDNEKETIASEAQYTYQQLELETIEPIKEWLYNYSDLTGNSMNRFAKYMVSSLKNTKENYNYGLSDLLNLYRKELYFYSQKLDFLREKEEIRKFYRILEDLEGMEEIQPKWVDEYLKMNGYEI